MVEIACDTAVFHFNKKHLEDPSIPMWTIKANGKSFYINHLDANIPWSTKETIDNPSTKGSIKFKHCLLTINDDNEAELRPLTKEDRERLKKSEGPYARLLIHGNLASMKQYMDQQSMRYSKIRKITGGCGTEFYVCDIFTKEDAALLSFSYHNEYRILQSNEDYYKWYDEKEQQLLAKARSALQPLFGWFTSKNDYIGDGDEHIEEADESDWTDED
jgi:hypothetical protein